MNTEQHTPKKTQNINITSEKVNDSELTGYRLTIYKKAAENCLAAAGYQTNKLEENYKHIHLKTKSNANEPKSDIICGPVLNAETRNKETMFTVEQYRSLRLNDMRQISEDRHPKPTLQNETFEILADACVKLTLLQVKIVQPVGLSLSRDFRKTKETACKGATFVMYNLSRLVALREKYSQGVTANTYPKLPSVEEADFTGLTDEDEWSLLFNYLLQYTTLIGKCAEDVLTGRGGIHSICNFLCGLCSTFSVYYRRCRILLTPKDHLIPVLQARLFLTMAVEQVLKNGLSLLDINTIEHM